MAKEVLDTIMSIQPKDSSGGSGETRESRVFRIATDMLEKLPEDYKPHEVSLRIMDCRYCVDSVTVQVKARLQRMGILSSMTIFLRQEVDRMQRVLSLVRSTLQDLQLAIEGTIIMSEVSSHRVCSLSIMYSTHMAEFEGCPGQHL